MDVPPGGQQDRPAESTYDDMVRASNIVVERQLEQARFADKLMEGISSLRTLNRTKQSEGSRYISELVDTPNLRRLSTIELESAIQGLNSLLEEKKRLEKKEGTQK